MFPSSTRPDFSVWVLGEVGGWGETVAKMEEKAAGY